jgi:hypothetical protein
MERIGLWGHQPSQRLTASIATEPDLNLLELPKASGQGKAIPSLLFHLNDNHDFDRANSVEDAMRRGQRQVEQVKLKLSMQMDDKTFQSALLETQVFFEVAGRQKMTDDDRYWLLQETILSGTLMLYKSLLKDHC